MKRQRKDWAHRRDEQIGKQPSRLVVEPQEMAYARDHLFISYAWEDRAFADWLYARLTAEGYRAWMDRKKLYGGERWTEEIDIAIKQRSFRFLALLSRYSLKKPNPSKERTIALALGRERNENFLIPLKIDRLRDTELDWLESDVTYISFDSWATGLRQLLKRLETLNTPRPLGQEGKGLAILRFLPENVVLDNPDRLYTNCFRFSAVPDTLRVARKTEASGAEEQDALPSLVYYPVGETHIAAFELGEAVNQGVLADALDVKWRETDAIFGVPPRNIVANLLRQTLDRELLRRGLAQDPDTKVTFFPVGLMPNDKLRYTAGSGRAVPVNAVGVKKLRGEKTRYHLAPVFRVRQDMGADFVAQLKVRIYLTDLDGSRLDRAKAFGRRKALTSHWFNHQWLTRYLAIAEFLSQGKSVIDLCKEAALRMESVAINGSVPQRINDEALEPLRESVPPEYEENYEMDGGEESL